jgi:hypothetical protein
MTLPVRTRAPPMTPNELVPPPQSRSRVRPDRENRRN